MTSTLVKQGRKIRGFVYQNAEGWWYAFGRPSAGQWIAFACRDKEHGIACIEMNMI